MMFARVAYILVLLIRYPQAVFNVIFSQKRGCLLECSVSPNYTPPRSLAQWIETKSNGVHSLHVQ